jgi:hypothetical protein
MAGAAAFTPCYCQDEAMHTVRGRVIAIDWVASIVVLQWFNSTEELSGDRLSVSVSYQTKIFKDAHLIGLTELKVSDHVIIRYYKEPPAGESKAVSIIVLAHDRPIPP